MSRSTAIILTALVGGLVALQPPANSAMARHVGDVGAAFVSITISLAIITVVLLVVGHPGRLSGLSAFRPEYAVGGIAGAAVVFVSLATVRPLGAGGVVALLVAGQLIVSVAADRFQWYGLHRVGITPGRSLGVLLVVAGTVLITRN
jgi:transporter family-2 protein